MILGTQEVLRYNNLILVLMGKGFHFRNIDIAGNVDGLGFFRKNHGNAILPGYGIGDGNAGGFDGKHLRDVLARKTAFEFSADLVQEVDIHLVIKEGINFQNIAGFYDSVFNNSLF